MNIRDRRVVIGAAVAGLILVLGIGALLLGVRVNMAGDDPPSRTFTFGEGSPTPTVELTASPGPTVPPEPTALPTLGSPEPRGVSASVEATIPAATPTQAPDPGLWRIEGVVVDEDGEPLEDVCVVIGPHGCQPFGPRTDERGSWFLDIAEGGAEFDFYFVKSGYQTVHWHVKPTGPTIFNVVLADER